MGSRKNKESRLPAKQRREARTTRNQTAASTVPPAPTTTKEGRVTRAKRVPLEAAMIADIPVAARGRSVGTLPPVSEEPEESILENDPYEELPEWENYDGGGGDADWIENEEKDDGDMSEEEIEGMLGGERDTYNSISVDEVDANSEASYVRAPIQKRPKKPAKPAKFGPSAKKAARGSKASTVIAVPDKYTVRLMIDIDGSGTMVIVKSNDSFETVQRTVAEMLEKEPEDINMRYKPSWATKASGHTYLATERDWEFLLEQANGYILKALSKKGNNGTIPPWTITVLDGKERPKGGGKKGGNGQDQDDNKPKGNLYWMRQLRNRYECTDKEHPFPCYVMTTNLYAPDIPKGYHCWLTPAALTAWARRIDSRACGIETMPDDILIGVLKDEGFKGGHQQEDGDVITRPRKNNKKDQAAFPQFLPFVLPSLESFAPFGSRSSDGERNSTKRSADDAELVDSPVLDGPKVADWLPILDEGDPGFPVVFRNLIAKTRGEGIIYLADILEFTAGELSEVLDIQLGTSKFIIRKAREKMENLKRGKRVRGD